MFPVHQHPNQTTLTLLWTLVEGQAMCLLSFRNPCLTKVLEWASEAIETAIDTTLQTRRFSCFHF